MFTFSLFNNLKKISFAPGKILIQNQIKYMHKYKVK